MSVSAFAAAELPETSIASNELTPDCTKRFATANIALCMPDGMPSISTLRQQSASMYAREKRRRHESRRMTRWRTMRNAERYSEMTLAMATPSAAFPQTMTKKRLRMTFSTPAIVRYVSGRFVSPLALSTPLPKLNIPIAGMPSA